MPPAAHFLGEVVAIRNPNALDQLRLAKRIIETSSDGLEDLEIDFDGNPGSPFRISARLTKRHASIVDINFVCGKNLRQKGLPIQDASGNIPRRLWAQQHLQKMELLGGHSRQAIIDFARQHTLVSDLTSLIVLELFEDHVTYRIPPPEAKLRQRYETAIARRPTTAWTERLE